MTVQCRCLIVRHPPPDAVFSLTQESRCLESAAPDDFLCNRCRDARHPEEPGFQIVPFSAEERREYLRGDIGGG